ncbi:hypothetical protein P3T18_006244 [Paraburkholderia sp. GAS199]|uniref:hypothetical protein n=1 Tax=Paraburkholderia sp. GAS199 TaxID=3035126 RepID=UPI003D1E6F3D
MSTVKQIHAFMAVSEAFLPQPEEWLTLGGTTAARDDGLPGFGALLAHRAAGGANADQGVAAMAAPIQDVA